MDDVSRIENEENVEKEYIFKAANAENKRIPDASMWTWTVPLYISYVCEDPSPLLKVTNSQRRNNQNRLINKPGQRQITASAGPPKQ